MTTFAVTVEGNARARLESLARALPIISGAFLLGAASEVRDELVRRMMDTANGTTLGASKEVMAEGGVRVRWEQFFRAGKREFGRMLERGEAIPARKAGIAYDDSPLPLNAPQTAKAKVAAQKGWGRRTKANQTAYKAGQAVQVGGTKAWRARRPGMGAAGYAMSLVQTGLLGDANRWRIDMEGPYTVAIRPPAARSGAVLRGLAEDGYNFFGWPRTIKRRRPSEFLRSLLQRHLKRWQAGEAVA